MGPYGYWQTAKPLTSDEAEQLRDMWKRKHAPPDNGNLPPSPRTPKPPSTLSRVDADAFMERNELERLCLADAPTDLERESLERSFSEARRPLPLPPDYIGGIGGKMSLAVPVLVVSGSVGFASALLSVWT